jgi:hypothetical protein
LGNSETPSPSIPEKLRKREKEVGQLLTPRCFQFITAVERKKNTEKVPNNI